MDRMKNEIDRVNAYPYKQDSEKVIGQIRTMKEFDLTKNRIGKTLEAREHRIRRIGEPESKKSAAKSK